MGDRQSDVVRSGRGEEGRVQRPHESLEDEKNRALKEVLEDVHVWSATAEQVAQVATSNVINAMSALSLSHPLVVIRVLMLQVSHCFFQSMCRVCPSIGTDEESFAAGSQASNRNSSRVRLPSLSGVAQRSKLMMLLGYVTTNGCHYTNLCPVARLNPGDRLTIQMDSSLHV